MSVPGMGDAAIVIAIGVGMIAGALIMLVAVADVRGRRDRREAERIRAQREHYMQTWKSLHAEKGRAVVDLAEWCEQRRISQ